MSHIHEALKKAEEERALTQSGENAKPRLIAAASAQSDVRILRGEEMPPLHSLGDTRPSSHRLRPDGLWERCGKPGTADSRMQPGRGGIRIWRCFTTIPSSSGCIRRVRGADNEHTVVPGLTPAGASPPLQGESRNSYG